MECNNSGAVYLCLFIVIKRRKIIINGILPFIYAYLIICVNIIRRYLLYFKAIIIAPPSMNNKNVLYLKFEENSSIYNFILIPNILSGWYLRRKNPIVSIKYITHRMKRTLRIKCSTKILNSFENFNFIERISKICVYMFMCTGM